MQRTVAEVADPIAFPRAATVSEHDCYAPIIVMPHPPTVWSYVGEGGDLHS